MKALIFTGVVGIVMACVVFLSGALNQPTTFERSIDITAAEEVIEPEQQKSPEEIEWDEQGEALKQAYIENERRKVELAALEENIATLEVEAQELRDQIAAYWTVDNLEKLIKRTFVDEPNTAVAIAWAESQMRVTQQSNHRYTFTDAKRGIYKGEREMSYCLFQIHAPDWDATAKQLGYEDYRVDPEDCVRMAYHIYTQRGSFKDWSVYNNRQHLAYLR